MKQEFIFTSSIALLFIFLVPGLCSNALATDGEKAAPKVYQPEEGDFSGTPFTEYGEFNEEAEEDAETKFFQYGRFFGVSLGMGFEGLTGNRGLLWQGGFPLVDFKVHYWFNFHVALDLGFFVASHFYNTAANGTGSQVDVNMLRAGVDIKYYFDTKNLSAPISFANPFILLGAGAFNKNESSLTSQTTEQDSSLGLSIGAGLEFAVAHRSTYFQLEGKYHFVRFRDNFNPAFASSYGIPDLSGGFYTFSGNLMFTW